MREWIGVIRCLSVAICMSSIVEGASLPDSAVRDFPRTIESVQVKKQVVAGSKMVKNISLNGEWQYLKSADGIVPNESDFIMSQVMKLPSNWFLKGEKSYPGESGLDYSGTMWFMKKFSVPAELKGSVLRLHFEMVDYFADVFMNGCYIGSHAGYFQPFEFEVQNAVRYGNENVLMVRVNSPALPVDRKEESEEGWPSRQNIVKGVFLLHDTRPGSMTDRGQEKNTGGIIGDVNLRINDTASLGLIKVTSQLNKNYDQATVTAEIGVTNHLQSESKLKISGLIRSKNFKSQEIYKAEQDVTISPGSQSVTLSFSIQNPRLWWTWDYGQPDLYQLEIKLADGKAVLDENKTVFGVREIRVAPPPDWTWTLNGKRIFPRGSNYISTQWLSEMDKRKYLRDVQLMKNGNMNAIRVHAHIEKKEFYEACDELGILVWQDFPLQWGYSDKKEFVDHAAAQLKDMIDHFYNNPSICVWCCHNESPFSVYTWMKQKVAQQNQVLDQTLEQKAKEWDRTRYVHINSGTGDGHPYDGWYGGKLHNYRNVPGAPMVTEYGAQALPNLVTLKKMFTEEEIWPDTESDWAMWKYHNFQKEQTFHTAGISQGKSIEEFIEHSQTYQALSVQYATEIFRRHKHSKVKGLFQFMFVEDWPSITWAVLDYYRIPKKGYHALKTAFQPLLPGIEYDLEKPSKFATLWIVNDYHRDFKNAKLKWRIESREGNSLQENERKIDIPADSVQSVIKVEGLEGISEGQKSLEVWIEDSSGKSIAQNQLSEEQYRVMALPKPKKGIADVKASQEKGDNVAVAAVDGDPASRWESEHKVDPVWITIQLDQSKHVRGVRIVWETASAKKYEVQISENAQDWKTVAAISDGKPGEDKTIDFEPQPALYLRIYGTERATEWGYSIWEIDLLQ